MPVTRLPNGIVNVDEQNILRDMGQLDPTKFVNFMEDFIDYLGPLTLGATQNNWISSGVGTGSLATDGTQGVMTLLTSNSSADSVFLIHNPINMIGFLHGPIWFKTSVIQAGLGDGDIVAGLADQASLTPTDGAFFRRQGDTTIWNLVIREDAAEVLSADIDPGTAGGYTLGFAWDGEAIVSFSLNGRVIGNLTLTTAEIPTPNLVPMMGAVTNEAAQAQLGVDYLFTAGTRR